MRRVHSIFTVFACFCFLTLALAAPTTLPGSPKAPAPTILGWVSSPPSRTAAQSNDVTLSGYVGVPKQTVTISAVDQNTGDRVVLGTIQASTSGLPFPSNPLRPSDGQKHTLYPWSYETGVLAANYWAPQQLAADVGTSQGHLELFASVQGSCLLSPRLRCPKFLPTFSDALALRCLRGISPCVSDGGYSTVLFDQYGVGGGPAPWMPVAGMISNPPSGQTYSSVAWSVGSYAVDDGTNNIYALICAPTTSGQYPMVVYNHGGINAGAAGDSGSLHGIVTSTGWTSPPAGLSADDLGQCVDWAKRGWIFAMSSYRAETIYIDSQDPAFTGNQWLSGAPNGGSELCLGEVTDVMALVDLLVHHTATIMLGNPNQPNQTVPINAWNGQLFMYGYSHGGCITYRAVEQGAPVDAFAVIEGFTDMSLNYLNNLANCNNTCTNPTASAAIGSGAVGGYKGLGGPGLYYPDASSGGMPGQTQTYPGVTGYNWRSANYFASRGDLSIKKFNSMPILILHGDIDYYAPYGSGAFNPVALDEPVELAPYINATEIFVGPSGFPFCTTAGTVPNEAKCIPISQPCIIGTGAPIVDPTTHEPLPGVPSSCQDNFTLMVPGPCLGGGPGTFGPNACEVLPLPGLHNLVVYHNMSHVNGGLGIQNQFNSFVQQNFGTPPGCDGVPISATTSAGFKPILCNN
jgi:hypothetical protein